MFIYDILVYIISIILAYFVIVLNVVTLVSIKEWIEKNKKEKKMEAIINFLKNGVEITFYGVLLIFGIFTLYGMLKGIVRVMVKKIFKWID